MIIFSISQTLFSKLIRKVTKSNVSHCAIYLGNELFLEANIIHGVRVVTREEFLKIQFPLAAYETSDNDFIIANELAHELDGTRYGYLDIIYILFKNVFLLRWDDLTDKGRICSEIAAQYIDRVYGTSLYDKKSPKDPGFMMDWCSSNLDWVAPKEI